MTVAAMAHRRSEFLMSTLRSGRLPAIATHAVALVFVAAWMLPTLGLLVNSFLPSSSIATRGWWTAISPPLRFTLDNYKSVLSNSNLGVSFFNSWMIAIPATVIPVAIAAYAAYALAWLKFPGRNLIFLALVGLLAVPLQLTFIPITRIFVAFGITPDQLEAAGVPAWLGLWLAHSAYGLPFAIYLLTNFFRRLPRDLMDSAEIDGANPLLIFYRIVLPLSRPAIASIVIFQFLWVWNDLLVALIYVGGTPEVAPMTVTLANLVGTYGQDYYLLTAAAFLSLGVPLAVFFAFQPYFVRGILAGSLKG